MGEDVFRQDQELQTVWANIDMESATATCAPSVLSDNAQEFPLELEGKYACPWLTTSARYGGAHALGLRLTPNPGPPSGPPKDWSELTADHMSFSYALSFGRVRYFGFAILVNGSSSDWPLAEDVHFMQAWEGHGTCGVPLVGTLMKNTGDPAHPLQFRFRAKWGDVQDPVSGSQTLPMKGAAAGSREITKGTWHTFVIRLAPSNSGDGAVKGNVTVTYDGEEIIHWDHDWGCNLPAGADQWMIRAGMYRPIPAKQSLVMLLDNVKIASSSAGATP